MPLVFLCEGKDGVGPFPVYVCIQPISFPYLRVMKLPLADKTGNSLYTWGRFGGPSHLGLAILSRLIDPTFAAQLERRFSDDIVMKLKPPFELFEADIYKWLDGAAFDLFWYSDNGQAALTNAIHETAGMITDVLYDVDRNARKINIKAFEGSELLTDITVDMALDVNPNTVATYDNTRQRWIESITDALYDDYTSRQDAGKSTPPPAFGLNNAALGVINPESGDFEVLPVDPTKQFLYDAARATADSVDRMITGDQEAERPIYLVEFTEVHYTVTGAAWFGLWCNLDLDTVKRVAQEYFDTLITTFLPQGDNAYRIALNMRYIGSTPDDLRAEIIQAFTDAVRAANILSAPGLEFLEEI